MISAAFYVCNAIYETIKKQRELTGNDLIACYLKRNYVSWNLIPEATFLKNISLDATFPNRSSLQCMKKANSPFCSYKSKIMPPFPTADEFLQNDKSCYFYNNRCCCGAQKLEN